MENNARKEHWEKVFTDKKITEVSWYQENPDVSMQLIKSVGLPKNAKVIDVGAGDSLLIDKLIEEGYTNVYALDISEKALERARKRLGEKAAMVNWIVSDVTQFKTETKFDFWHDRAAFHFLASEEEIKAYLQIAKDAVTGFLSIGTFSTSGPEKCSGLNIKQYSKSDLKEIFQNEFRNLKCFDDVHLTPSGTEQSFTFCLFKRIP